MSEERVECHHCDTCSNAHLEFNSYYCERLKKNMKITCGDENCFFWSKKWINNNNYDYGKDTYYDNRLEDYQ